MSQPHLNGYCNGTTAATTNGHHHEPAHTPNGHTTTHENGFENLKKKQPVTVPVEGFSNVSESDSSAYLRNYKTHQTGISHEEMVKAYSEWANNYDQDLCPGRYNGPQIAANAMAQYYTSEEERASIQILDVAAGTGRVGHELYDVGFRRIDALEPSNGMLSVLVGRGIYSQTFESSIGYGPVASIPDSAYDSLVIAGGMGEGHIPISAFDEMIRVVRPGGTVFIVMREEYLSYVKEYVDKLEPTMEKLQEEGLWKQVSRTIVPEYSFNKNGIVYNYQISKQ